ncbi:MAG: hypothetical protein ACRDH9_10895 [Actinomycetota bacterium]
MRIRRHVLTTALSVAAAFAALPLPAAVSDPAPVEPAFGPLSSPIRPGSSMGGCTYNYIFYELVYPTPEVPNPIPDVFIGTAGHCTDEPGERVELPGLGEIGTVVYDSDVVDSNVDFSLIELDPERVGQTNPQMRGFEGPKGVATPAMLALGDRVDIYGYGIGVGSLEQTRPRFGFLTDWTDNEYVADMPAVNGDSGAPLLHDESGFALGVISRYGIDQVPPSTDVGPLVDWVLREVRAAGFDVTLATID